MARPYLGAHEVNIPIDDILRECAAWCNEIVNAVGNELLKEVRKNARNDFDDKTGLLRSSIAKKKSKFGDDTHIVGAFAPHAHLIEFGHDVTVAKGGEVVGHAPATLFLTAAGQAVEARLAEIAAGVDAPSIEVKR